MTSTARPLTEVLKDILDNLQDIVRSEAKFAKAELRDELDRGKVTLVWITVAATTGLFAFTYLLLCVYSILRYALPAWAAAAIIALILAAVCGLSLVIGLKRGATTALPSSSTTIAKVERNLGERAGSIEMHIQSTRRDLSANIDELEQKVKSVIDWRKHYETHRAAYLGAALGAGFLLSLIGRRRRTANFRQITKP